MSKQTRYEYVKINFGCAIIQPSGWINIDNDSRFHAPFNSLKQLVKQQGNVDIIVAHHSIQTIPYDEIDEILQDFYKLLKPDGIVRVSIPDILSAFNAYKKKDISWFPKMSQEPLDDRFCRYLTWYGQNITPYTEKSLIDLFVKNGFKARRVTTIKKNGPKNIAAGELDSRVSESIYIEATK